ncbi:MAG: hypothetical protein VX044_08595 [Planctomycetota bacterium]|nr:hypothetical protein [Planctomycetota bacterium]
MTRPILAPSFALVLTQLAVTAQADAGYDPSVACAEISTRADRGELTVPVALRVLGSDREAEARTVAAIIRHEWARLPDALFDGLDLDPRAARRVLFELARAPRPAARNWVASQARQRGGRSYDHRLLALAARSGPLTRDEAKLLVESLEHEPPSDGFYLACGRLTPKLADGLVGRVHGLLMKGEVPLESLAPLLDGLSPRGTKSLLGLAMTLPPAVGYGLLRQVVDARPEQAYERIDAALDGRVPLDPAWLAFAGKRIDRPERVARVLQILRDADDEADRDLAFEALLTAKAIDAEVLAAATDTDSPARVRRVIARAANSIPAEYVVRWLAGAPEVVVALARALVRRPQLEPAVQAALLDLLRDVEVASRGTPLYLLAAIVQGGDAAALARVWPLVVASDGWRDLFDRLGRREEAFVQEQLRTGLEQARARVDEREGLARLDTLRLLLVARGDQDEQEALVRNAPLREAEFARRCRKYGVAISAAQARALAQAAFVSEDAEQAGELLEWAARAQPAATSAALWRFWTAPPADGPASEELQEIALRLLTASERRGELVVLLRQALAAGPLDDAMSSLPYAALSSMPALLKDDDVRLCAELVLLAPLSDPAAEQRQVRRWPDGTFGFPLVQATASRLRDADPAQCARVFAALVDELREHPSCRSISRQRLTVFWRSLSRTPTMQRALGAVTARLWPLTAADAAVSDAAALWLQALDAERRGELADAERGYRAAGRALLRLPSRRAEARWLIGERDPNGGVDPLAALAAAPYRARWLAARAAGDAAAQAQAAAMVREFAGHDEATRASVSEKTEDSGR